MAHGVYVDAQDFVWTIDEGTNTVIKWNPNTARPEMILGRRHESLEGLGPAIAPMPPPHPYAFNRPNDVVTDAQGNIFVADGYNNSRAIKYDKERQVRGVDNRHARPRARRDAPSAFDYGRP